MVSFDRRVRIEGRARLDGFTPTQLHVAIKRDIAATTIECIGQPYCIGREVKGVPRSAPGSPAVAPRPRRPTAA